VLSSPDHRSISGSEPLGALNSKRESRIESGQSVPPNSRSLHVKGHTPTLRELQGSEFGVDLPPVTFLSDNELLCEGFHYGVLGGDWGVTVGAWPHQTDGLTPAFVCTDSWLRGGSPNLRRIENGNKPPGFAQAWFQRCGVTGSRPVKHFFLRTCELCATVLPHRFVGNRWGPARNQTEKGWKLTRHVGASLGRVGYAAQPG
jgi:hypothetical protein